MYKLKTFFMVSTVIFSLLSPSVALSQGWLFQTVYPTSDNLTDVKFVSRDKGWVIGWHGTILYTEDGGNNWVLQESGTTRALNSIFFIDEKNGWIAAAKGMLLHTDNGGKTWAILRVGPENSMLYRVHFVSPKEGVAAGNDFSKGKMEGILFKTTDGGKTWEQIPSSFKTVQDIFFMDMKTGYLLADYKVFMTEDGGKTWEGSQVLIEKKSPEMMLSQASLMDTKGRIWFADRRQGWASVSYSLGTQIYHTDDGGKTWKFRFSGGIRSYNPPPIGPGGRGGVSIAPSISGSAYDLPSLFFAGDKKGCIAGSDVLCTEDGGLTWEKRSDDKQIESFLLYVMHYGGGGNTSGITAGTFVSSTTAWIVGNKGLIMKTNDNGKNWELKTNIKQVNNAHFIDAQTGFAYKDGFIVKTADKGETWVEKAKLESEIMQFFFVDNLNGWAHGQLIKEKDNYSSEDIYGYIYHTSDGGETWALQLKRKISLTQKDPLYGFLSIFFTDANTGWVAGGKGLILSTKDGGKTWRQQKSGTKLTLKGVYFVDSDKGWIIGDSGVKGLFDEGDPQPEGVILYTKDGGQHWHRQWTRKDIWLTGIFFSNKDKGWVTGEGIPILHTEDGGKNWQKKEIADAAKEDYSPNSPFFVDEKHGWITLVAERAEEFWSDWALLITDDGGKTWKRQKKELHKFPWRPFLKGTM